MLACFIGILWLVFCLIASPVRAQFIERTTSYQTENPVIVDGKLDEAAWNSAVLLGPFRSNDRALPTRTSTFARLLWDRDFLYVALQCEDFDLQSEKMGRDHRIWETDDNIKLVIDPDGDGKDFLSWTINPLNALLDYHRPDEWATENVHWNAAGVQTAVEIDGTISNARDEDRGWRAEIAIPWSVFAPFAGGQSLPPQAGAVWRIGLYREDRSAADGLEIMAWSPTRQHLIDKPERLGAVLFDATSHLNYPVLALASYQVRDATGRAIDKNISPQPDEERMLDFAIKNHTAHSAHDVRVALESRHAEVQVVASPDAIEQITGEGEVLSGVFHVRIGEGYVAHTPIPMQLVLEDANARRWIENVDLYLDNMDDRPYTLRYITDEKGIDLRKKWRYRAGDDISWSDPDYDDGEWEWVDPALRRDDLPAEGWSGRGWFRTRVRIDSTLWDMPLALEQMQWGASEIYLNGRLLHSFGEVGSNRDDERLYGGPLDPVPFLFDRQYEQHIAVRYANSSFDLFRANYGMGGFFLQVTDLEKSIGLRGQQVVASMFAQVTFSGISLLICLLHLLLFLFYPQARENLYYAITTVFFAIFFYSVSQGDFTTDTIRALYVSKVAFLAMSLALLAAVRFTYALFYDELPKLFWGLLIMTAGTNIWVWFNPGYGEFSTVFVGCLLVLCAELIRVQLKPILAQRPHTWIIAIGFLCLIVGSVHFALSKLDIIVPIVDGPTYNWGIIALLVAMSIYLTRTVAQTHKDRDFVQSAFGQYLSPAVVEQIVSNPEMVDQLGGEERVMTAFFSDIASFSTFSECLQPIELVHFLNEYLSEMCDIIEQYGGTIDKFEGDAIVAFFGAPIFFEDHAIRATLACIDQQKELEALRVRWRGRDDLPPALLDLWDSWESEGRTFCHVRMGLASGPMVVGNMGSQTRTDYTMMGDTVNLAARFESGQKIYGTDIVVNEAIYRAVCEKVETRKLDTIQVMGKEEPVAAYEVLGRKGLLSEGQYRVLDYYNKGMEAYEAFDFPTARDLFRQALEVDPTDGPSLLYVDRCADFILNPPADLIFRAQNK
jgi:class 3 adenylate cyclase